MSRKARKKNKKSELKRQLAELWEQLEREKNAYCFIKEQL